METSVLAVCICCLLLTRAGAMLYHMGMARSKNAASAMVRSVCDFATTSLVFFGFGAAILLQNHNGYLGIDLRLALSENVGSFAYLTLLLAASSHMNAAIGERSRFRVVPVLSALLAAVIVPIIGHWTWAGFLKRWGVVDVAGAISLHVPMMVVALLAAKAVGPRQGKYNRDGSCNAIPGHSLPLMGAGFLLTMAGWLAYLTLATWMWADVELWRPTLGGILAAASGLISAMAFSQWRFGKVDVLITLSGGMCGLAGVTAGAGLLPGWAAMLLGAICGIVGNWGAIWLDTRWRIDDASGLAAGIGISAALSAVFSPLFIAETMSMRFTGCAYGALGLALSALTAGACGYGALAILKATTAIRSREADEFDGLDLAEHDVNAYPDFQQTMIKSHHLRQM